MATALLLLPTISNAAPWWWPWPTTSVPDDVRTKAVKDTISATQSCRDLGNFYWEIGDRNARLASGRVGILYDANTVVNLASASKWPFAAYFVQRFGTPTATQVQDLTMRSGHIDFNDALCVVQTTMGSCYTAPTRLAPLNNNETTEEVGFYHYNGGHFQKLAVDAGLGSLTTSGLQTDMRSRLGADTGLSVRFPVAASALRMSANGYVIFMRKIMNNQLTLSGLMGSGKVCTQPGTCPMSIYSPLSAYDWDYSLGHWVERDTGGTDEAYSSIGLYGFYPWITADKQYYGVISMEDTLNLTIARKSVACGRNIRHAWLTGVMQN